MTDVFLTSGVVILLYLYVGWCLRWASAYTAGERSEPIREDPELFAVWLVAWPCVLMVWRDSMRGDDE